MHIQQLEEQKREQIEKELRDALEALGDFEKSEIEDAVQNGMNSRLEDLRDVIDISKYKK